ncbi:MAG TPA: SRPBCC domain-containing protein [Ktedonobacterales bacterium]
MQQTHLHRRSIEKDMFIKATPERVFQALTEKAELERWFVQTAEIDLRVGGAIRLEWAPGMFETGTIIALEPPHRLSYTWEAFEPSPTTVTFELTAKNDGTRLHLSHTGVGEGEDWDAYYSSVNPGWNMHLTNLTAWLETGSCETPEPSKGR